MKPIPDSITVQTLIAFEACDHAVTQARRAIMAKGAMGDAPAAATYTLEAIAKLQAVLLMLKALGQGDAAAAALVRQDERIAIWMVEHWNSTTFGPPMDGRPLHQWIADNALRCGGVLAAAAEIKNLSDERFTKLSPRPMLCEAYLQRDGATESWACDRCGARFAIDRIECSAVPPRALSPAQLAHVERQQQQ